MSGRGRGEYGTTALCTGSARTAPLTLRRLDRERIGSTGPREKRYGLVLQPVAKIGSVAARWYSNLQGDSAATPRKLAEVLPEFPKLLRRNLRARVSGSSR